MATNPLQHIPNDIQTISQPSLPYPTGGGIQWLESLAATYNAEQGGGGGVGISANGGGGGSGSAGTSAKPDPRQRKTYEFQVDMGKEEERVLAAWFDALIARREFKPTLLMAMAAAKGAEGVFL